MKQNKMPPPPNWNPQESPKVVWNNMKPFIYSPLPGIIYHNRVDSTNVKVINGNQGMQPYHNNDPSHNKGV